VVTIAGKHCETGDILAKDVVVPRVDQGDIIVVATTGAYNYSQSSNYNRTPRPAIVMVSGDTSDVIVRRETIEELMAFDVVPARLRAGGGD
jgi:diaminopimelate decarboxylase